MATKTQRDNLADVAATFGVGVGLTAVCPGHSAPVDFLASWVFDRPSVSLVCGPRGGGKSYLRSFATHIDSIRHDFHGTRVLGGSLAQSGQIYSALRDFDRNAEGLGLFRSFTKTQAVYSTGAEVSILAASSTSVRGPHVASLCLDEVDEIDEDIRESSVGMCMAQGGVPAAISMTSTWHRVGGPMTGLMERARAGDFPLFTFCAFEVLERCPAERSGRPTGGPDLYENCPSCQLVKWCHSHVAPGPDGTPLPKAKRSSGHYAIDSLIQKVETVSLRVFEADYLCLGPKADGVWFSRFDATPGGPHVNVSAEFDPSLDVHASIDSGVFTGAVLFQSRDTPAGKKINVFADLLTEGLTAEANALAVVSLSESLCNGRRERVSTDPSGASRNAIGPTVIAEYERAGLRPTVRRDIERWPIGSVADSLATLEALVESASGGVSLTIHPRCKHLISAFQSYRRAKRQGQLQDYPEDPQHPAEDLIDALRGGIRVEMPEGRKAASTLPRIPARRIF